MMSEVKQQLQQDVKVAMKARDKARVAALRLVLAAIKQVEIDERIELDDNRIISILDKLRKQRKEAIVFYQQADRKDLEQKEKFELEIIENYLPKQLAQTEINDIINAAIEASGANSLKDMGAVMSIVKNKLQGRADLAEVSKKIRQHLETSTK